ncbi:MAG: Epimerase family protein [Frankiales bacterium]|nr:Epimerase family protein [Frankiales bacterium]
MKIAITGATGLIGRPLVTALKGDGHDVVRFVRGVAEGTDRRWDPAARELVPDAVADLDAIVHLAGAGVADKRWTSSYKQTILASRVDGTATIAAAVAAARAAGSGPSVLLSGSAIGFYGDTGDRVTDETGPSGQGFLAEVCRRWEAATGPAEAAGVRVAHLRTGIVLAAGGGALGKQATVVKAFLGAPLGNGRQWQSWISLVDEIGAIRHLLTAPVHGPVNLVSPHPVTQRDFTSALGRVLHRPVWPVPVPGVALSAVLGPFAREGVLAGQRLEPKVLLDTGYTFVHTEVEQALRACLTAA